MPPIVLILDPFAAIATPAGCACMASPGVAIRSDGDRTPCQVEQSAGFWSAEGMQPSSHSLHPVGTGGGVRALNRRNPMPMHAGR
jgi:hypothetical protein